MNTSNGELAKPPSSSHCQRNRKNTFYLALWTVAWLLTMKLTVYGAQHIWNYDILPTTIAVAVHLAAGAGVVVANIRHHRGQDELQQRIMYETATFTLGLGVVVSLSYGILEKVNLIDRELQVSELIIVLGISYLVTMVMLHRKYK